MSNEVDNINPGGCRGGRSDLDWHQCGSMYRDRNDLVREHTYGGTVLGPHCRDRMCHCCDGGCV